MGLQVIKIGMPRASINIIVTNIVTFVRSVFRENKRQTGDKALEGGSEKRYSCFL